LLEPEAWDLGPGAWYRETGGDLGYLAGVNRRSLWWEFVTFGAAVGGVYLAFVRTGVGQRLDMTALAGTNSLPGVVVVEGRGILDAVGIGTLAAIAFGIGAFAVLRGRMALAVTAAVMVVGANLTTQVLKHSLLSRPLLIPGGVLHPNSYPSGHATAAASLAVAVFLVVPHRWRAPTALGTTIAAAAFGTATVVVGWHRPSDVIGAWFVVGAWAALSTAILLAIRGSGVAAKVDRWRVRGEVLLIAGAVAATVAFAVSVGTWAWIRFGNAARLEWIERGMAFVVSAAGIFGSSLAVAASLVLGLRRLTFEREAS
jgi:membrane-associated phospholipid phosphatase